MKILDAGVNSLMIFANRSEIDAAVGENADIGGQNAPHIVRALLAKENVFIKHICSIEVIDGDDELMITVHYDGDDPAVFIFYDIESIISASHACGKEMRSTLVLYSDRYMLIVYPGKSGIPAALYEYGEMVKISATYADMICEHGKKIAFPYALDVMRQYF